MTITGSNTTNFGFQKLGSNDSAGYSTINEVVDGIDTILNTSDRLIKAGQTPTVAYVITGDGTDWVRGLVVTASITDLNVTTGKIADLAVTEGKIADSAVTSAKIADGTIVNADINSSAAIDKTKISGTAITAGDTGTVTSTIIANDTIVNADINSSAGIVDTKLATISTAGKVANSATTAASANGNDTIVARDSAGNFAADTITASSFVGTATRASNLTGTTIGSVPYQSASNTTSMLAPGANGTILTSGGSGAAPSWEAISSGSVTLAGDVTGAANANSIGTGAVTTAKLETSSSASTGVTTAKIADNNVTYAKLNADAKTYDVPTSGTGVYFTASGDFTSASLSTASAQNPVVISAASSAIDLSLPNTVGTEGATITVCQTGTGAVTIKPKVGATATINGSTSNTYILGTQYSVVTLICLSNSGSNGTWVITGDYY